MPCQPGSFVLVSDWELGCLNGSHAAIDGGCDPAGHWFWQNAPSDALIGTIAFVLQKKMELYTL